MGSLVKRCLLGLAIGLVIAGGPQLWRSIQAKWKDLAISTPKASEDDNLLYHIVLDGDKKR
jgi:hypothetical protein